MTTESYRTAGVDIDAYDAWLESLQRALPVIGGFGGLFPIGEHIRGMADPCLVSGTDGVGTKVLVARAAGDLSSIGIDCVAMVVNDLLCSGARPLFFLDYLALGKFSPTECDSLIAGVRAGCEDAGCALIGGETAELPGLMPPGHFDIAGFGVGVVDRSRVVDGSRVAPGDVVIGLESSGVHSNGFSLARRVLPEYESDIAVARELLTPTRIYVRPVLALLDRVAIRGIAHITGGGLPGNLCRVLPPTCDARLDPAAWPVPPVFARIQTRGNVAAEEMFRAFNMGIGMCLVVAKEDVTAALQLEGARVIGEITAGRGDVVLAGIA